MEEGAIRTVNIQTTEKVAYNVTATAKGPSGHAANWHCDGLSAIEQAADVLSRNSLYNAVLRTGASLTILQGGIRNNVIPSEGRATFNLRVLPGEDVAAVVREMNRAGGEPQVTFHAQWPAGAIPTSLASDHGFVPRDGGQCQDHGA